MRERLRRQAARTARFEEDALAALRQRDLGVATSGLPLKCYKSAGALSR